MSTILSVSVMRNKKRKWLSLLSAFIINVIILGVAYWFLIDIDEESRLFGIDFHKRYYLLIAIPFITCVNYFIVSVVKKDR